MAVSDIPNRTDLTHYELSVVLDGVTYVLEFRWNLRDAAWYFDIRLEDETNVANGIKVVINWPLLRGLRSDSRPPGELFAFDTSGAGFDPVIDNLGSTVKLSYYDATSLAELKVAL